MNISKSSWHYRYMNWMSSGWPPEDLCPYVRNLLFYLVMSFFMTGFVILVTVVPLAEFLAWVAAMIVHGTLLAPQDFAILFLAELFVAAVIAGVAGIHYWSKTWDTENNVAFAWVAAKHNKFCPRLNFQD